MSKIFVIADTHFGHDRVIEYCDRPYEHVKDMDACMIDFWNMTVGEDDVVWHLGDFALTGRDRTIEIIKQLNGVKKIIVSNHDRSVKWYQDNGFEYATKKTVVIPMDWCQNGTVKRFHALLSHRPLDNEDEAFSVWDNPFNVHGHVHNTMGWYSLSGKHVCVCVEKTSYKPVSLQDTIVYAVNIRNANWKKVLGIEGDK